MSCPEKKIALYSGSFNPPTRAHRDIGESILAQIAPDEVWYLVSPQNPQKPTQGMLAFEHRVAMTELNIAGSARLRVSALEMEISQKTHSTYSIDTIRELLKLFPAYHFMWVVGADCFVQLHTWKNFELILSGLPIIVVPRPGWTQQIALSRAAQHPASQRHPASQTFLLVKTGYCVLDFHENAISATEARTQLQLGKKTQSVRDGVYEYICKNNLFPEKGGLS